MVEELSATMHTNGKDLHSKSTSTSPSPIIQRFKFNMRDCHAGESLANYVAELTAL